MYDFVIRVNGMYLQVEIYIVGEQMLKANYKVRLKPNFAKETTMITCLYNLNKLVNVRNQFSLGA